MRPRPMTTWSTLFQSTLPVSGERCLRPGQYPASARSGFNPRSPFPGSDAADDAPAAGVEKRFNPRSPFPGSDAHQGPVCRRCAGRVSIHAPRFRGAMPSPKPCCVRRWRCFNPRSPFPGSDACLPWPFGSKGNVSIHAPRFRGAMRWWSAMNSFVHIVSIHAPRFRGAMRNKRVRSHALQRFQSTLPVSGERCVRSLRYIRKRRSEAVWRIA